LKFQAVAEKTAKDARGLLYFAAPGTCQSMLMLTHDGNKGNKQRIYAQMNTLAQ